MNIQEIPILSQEFFSFIIPGNLISSDKELASLAPFFAMGSSAHSA